MSEINKNWNYILLWFRWNIVNCYISDVILSHEFSISLFLFLFSSFSLNNVVILVNFSGYFKFNRWILVKRGAGLMSEISALNRIFLCHVNYYWNELRNHLCVIFWPLAPGLKMLFQGNTPEWSDTFQRPVIERDRVGGLRLMIWEKVKVPFCHYSHALEESNLWTAWQLFSLDDD